MRFDEDEDEDEDQDEDEDEDEDGMQQWREKKESVSLICALCWKTEGCLTVLHQSRTMCIYSITLLYWERFVWKKYEQ